MNSGDTAWILACSALVLLMTPGVAFFYGGLVRRTNAAATMMHSFMTIGIVGVVWVLWGYSLAFGPDIGGVIGSLEWIGLRGVSATEAGPYSDAIPHQAFMIFQAMFAIITPALVTGAFAERMKFSAFVIFIVLWVTLVYAPLAHWVWGGGWLGSLGALDFAGGTVVHISAGMGALAAALLVGKRVGFQIESMAPHNVPMVVLGASLLWFGWFGFNAGSALAADGVASRRSSDQRICDDQHRYGRGLGDLGGNVMALRQEAQRGGSRNGCGGWTSGDYASCRLRWPLAGYHHRLGGRSRLLRRCEVAGQIKGG